MSAATLTHDEVVQRLRRAVSAMRKVCELEFVILFGSYAYGEPHEGSDVDVLVVYPDEVSEKEQEKAKAVMQEVFGGCLEVHSYRLSQWRQALLTRNWFITDVTHKGLLIFSRHLWQQVLMEAEHLMQHSQNVYPNEWLERAERDWGMMHFALNQGWLPEAAFHLRQAVEKWLKAYLLWQGWRLVRAYDLEELLKEAIKHEPALGVYEEMCRRVKEFVAARYPGVVNPPTEEELKRWIEQVKSLREFVRKTLNAHP